MASNVIRVGNVEIMQLSDGMLEFDLCNFFPTIPESEWSRYESHLTDEHKVRFNLGSYLIRADRPDDPRRHRPRSAAGRHAGRPVGRADAGLRGQGRAARRGRHGRDDASAPRPRRLEPPARGERYVPTFPKARYWMSAVDWETCHQPDVQPTRFPNAPTCVWPLEQLGLVELMHGEHSITPELTAVPTPGHTPGHVSILVTSGGERALVLGDAAHTPRAVPGARLGLARRHGPGADAPDAARARRAARARGDPRRGRPLRGARLRPRRAPGREALLARALG